MFDSSQANIAYYNHILAHLERPPMSREQFAYVHMHTVDESLAFLIADPDALAAARRFRLRMSYLPFIRHMIKEPYLDRLLAALHPAYKTAVATNRTDTMQRVLKEHGLDGAFDRVVTALDVSHPKPHPEQLLVLLSHFAIEASEMVYIGDSELDAEAAHQASVPFIAYANPGL
ncbi:MAG: HAD hydrolase-like protein, partial [Desulfosarcinaceae bacterium]